MPKSISLYSKKWIKTFWFSKLLFRISNIYKNKNQVPAFFLHAAEIHPWGVFWKEKIPFAHIQIDSRLSPYWLVFTNTRTLPSCGQMIQSCASHCTKLAYVTYLVSLSSPNTQKHINIRVKAICLIHVPFLLNATIFRFSTTIGLDLHPALLKKKKIPWFSGCYALDLNLEWMLFHGAVHFSGVQMNTRQWTWDIPCK